MKKFVLYVARWQLSTPILWLVVSRLGTGIEATIIANLIGASIFFWVDRFIFRSGSAEVWEVKQDSCDECGSSGLLRRLVLAPGGRASGVFYDRRQDRTPEYRCPACSESKLRRLKSDQKIRSIAAVPLA